MMTDSNAYSLSKAMIVRKKETLEKLHTHLVQL